MTEVKIRCQWCDGTAFLRGKQHIGFGPNMLSYECQKCKAKIVFLRHPSKEIESINIDLKYKE